MGQRKHRDRGYSEKKKQPWSERHRYHSIRVGACPFCYPGSPTVKEQESKEYPPAPPGTQAHVIEHLVLGRTD